MKATLVLKLSGSASNYSLVQMPCETNRSRTELWLDEISQEKGLKKFADLISPDSRERRWFEDDESDFIKFHNRLSERFENLSDSESRNNQIFFHLTTESYIDSSKRKLYGSGEIVVSSEEKFGNLRSSFLVLEKYH
jgi:hypothetical protein